MRALVLAAGYATRLYPLTRNRPKPLLPVGGRPLLDYTLERIRAVEEISSVAVVTNSRFVDTFRSWRDSRDFGVPVEIIDDGTSSNGDRLGALGDIRFSLDALGAGGDWLIVAGDNLFPFSFGDLVRLSRAREADAISCYRQVDVARLRRTGVVTLADDGRVLEFVEKPPEPPSQWAVPPLYVYTEESIAALETYLGEGQPVDAPGNFVRWLCRRRPVVALQCESGPHDIGDLESYREVDRLFTPGRGRPGPTGAG